MNLTNVKTVYLQITRWLNYGLFLAFVALLPFPQLPLRYAFGAWLVSWLLEGRWLSKPKPLRQNKMFIPFAVFGLWFVWKAVSVMWAPDHSAWAWQMERYLAFALILPIGLWGVNGFYNWRTAGKVLIAGCLAAIPFYVLLITVLYHHSEWVAVFDSGHNWMAHDNWWMCFADNVSLFKHRLFLCSVEMFGVVLSLQMFRHRKWLMIILVLAMLSVVVLTGSRQSVLTCAALAVAGVICAMPRRFRLRYGVGILLLGIAIGGGLLMLHPRMEQFDVTDIAEMRDISNEHNVRFNIWGVALQQPSDYFWHGLGGGQSTPYMLERYKALHLDYYASKQLNCHNQYLEELIELGIFGLLLFMAAWVVLPVFAKKRGRKTALLLTTLFMLNMLTDCMFGRFCGIALWVAGMIFVLLQSYPEGEEQTTGDAK